MSLDQLIAHPKTWLRANALWPSGQLNVMAKGAPDVFKVGTAQEGSRVWPVVLRPMGGVECKRSDGTPLPCWEIAYGGAGSSLAYYLPWRPNSSLSMVIGDKADFFITDTMNGCTFAFAPGGQMRVAHVNYNTFNDAGEREEGKPIDQGHMNAEVNRLIGPGAPALRKADYATGNFPNVTVIGVRHGGIWKFCYQKRDYIGTGHTGKSYRYKGVHSIR
jgi:hypothetical protein